MRSCRLIIDGDVSSASFRNEGAYNMAVDELLLHAAAERDQTTLRFYGWQPATLSLGYFQTFADRQAHHASSHCALVRRASGGGAILHDRELTYCFATPAQSRFGAADLYLAFHESLIQGLAAFGVQAALHHADDGLSDDAFLCFQRRASGDVTCEGYKVAGSAQRRWKNAILQHGSVLLAQSTYAPELPGLKELGGFNAEIAEVIAIWLAELGSRLKIEFQTGGLTDKETEGAMRLRTEKFAHESWARRR